MTADEVADLPTETVAIADLKPHPRNYRSHPADQIEHLAQSLREHGVYRNIVVAEDSTILAGHGIVAALKTLGRDKIRVVRLPIPPDHPKALKLLTGDNELGLRAEIDDRALTELLREIKEVDLDGLLGTGYDDDMLAALAFVTRPMTEIATEDAARHWVGLPGYTADGGNEPRLVVTCATVEERQRLLDLMGITTIHKGTLGTLSVRWPPSDREDLSSVRFDDNGADGG